MKHIWQSDHQHAASAFQVTEDPAGFGRESNRVSIAMLPLSQLGQKTLPFGRGPDRHDLKKEVS
jgi:hypothetical protein